MGSQVGEAESMKILSHAYVNGIKFLDTAEGYPTIMRPITHGETETLIGDWLKIEGFQDVEINTKVFGPGEIFRGGKTTLEEKEVTQALEDSLNRLQVDKLKCYMFHWPDAKGDLEEQVGYMNRFISEGKIESWGLSNASYETYDDYMEQAKKMGLEGPSIVQNHYSYGMDPSGVEQAPVPLMAYGVLMWGALSGKYKDGIPDNKCRLAWLRDYYGQPVNHRLDQPTVEVFLENCGNKDPVHEAIRFVYDKPFTKNIILGVTNIDQLNHILANDLIVLEKAA
jgi:aryl-alcohol dehydrogenase-like predicted oxidoreductase